MKLIQSVSNKAIWVFFATNSYWNFSTEILKAKLPEQCQRLGISLNFYCSYIARHAILIFQIYFLRWQLYITLNGFSYLISCPYLFSIYLYRWVWNLHLLSHPKQHTYVIFSYICTAIELSHDEFVTISTFSFLFKKIKM